MSSKARREQTAESLLIAAGVRRDPKVKAATQLRRLSKPARSAARETLNAWWGGSYRGADLSAGKTRSRRRTHERRAVLAAAGTPVETQPTAAAAVDRAWRGLDPAERQAAEVLLADAGPVLDLATVPTVEAEPEGLTLDDLDVADDEVEDFLAGPDTGTGSGLDGGLDRPLMEVDAPTPGAPVKAYLSDAELEVFLGGDGLEDVEDLTGPGGGAGHWWANGPGFDTPEELAAYIEAEEFDWAAIAELAFDGEEWRVWFPDDSP
jgi:hypothetical protein